MLVPARVLVVLLALAPIAACRGGGVGSIGAVLARDNETGGVLVKDVPAGLAAERAGLEPGDRILMIDGVYVGTLDAKKLREHLRGEVGASVELTVVHLGAIRRVKLLRTPLKEDAKPAPPPRETRLAE